MSSKYFIQPDKLRIDSYKLGAQIISSGWIPDFMIVLWRGGAIPGCYIHELFKFRGYKKVDHIAIRTAKYMGIDQAFPKVKVYNLAYALEQLKQNTKLLIVDDVSDTGDSIEATLNALREGLGDEMPVNFKTAQVCYKPKRNQTGRVPDYYVEDVDRWIVFPHELEGLTHDEIREGMGEEVDKIVTGEM
jgi:uncharacterized protein